MKTKLNFRAFILLICVLIPFSFSCSKKEPVTDDYKENIAKIAEKENLQTKNGFILIENK